MSVMTPAEETANEDITARPASPRGFAAMNSDRQREIASLGGRTAHERGQAHEFTSEEARQAGRKGGEIVSRNRDYMVAIGRRGGVARSISLQQRQVRKERQERQELHDRQDLQTASA